MTRKEFAPVFATLEAAFGAQNEARSDVYFEDFQQVEVESFRAAAVYCRRYCKWFPSIAELFDALPGFISVDSAANEAWQRVIRAAESNLYTSYNPATGSVPTGEKLTAEEMAAVGGSRGLIAVRDACGNGDGNKQLGYLKRDFLQGYRERMVNSGLALNPGGESGVVSLPERSERAIPAVSGYRAIESSCAGVAGLESEAVSEKTSDEILSGIAAILKRRIFGRHVDQYFSNYCTCQTSDACLLLQFSDWIAYQGYEKYLAADMDAATFLYFGKPVTVKISVNS